MVDDVDERHGLLADAADVKDEVPKMSFVTVDFE